MSLNFTDIQGYEVTDLKAAQDLIDLLVERLKKLEAALAAERKTSTTSHKPPSSDIVKPAGEQRQKGRKTGAQKGHKRQSRILLPLEQVDIVVEDELENCPTCCVALSKQRQEEVLRHQVAELVDNPVTTTEYRRYGHICPCCEVVIYPGLPKEVANSVCGERLQALIGYMKGKLGISYSELKDLCGDVLGFDISRGALCDSVKRVSAALKRPYEHLARNVAKQKTLNVDETGWRDSGSCYWVWVFCNQLIAFFTISHSRGRTVLEQTLGSTFGGALTSDFYSAYVAYANEQQQYCLAHLIRDIKFLVTLPDRGTRVFGTKLLGYLRRLFRLWHRRDEYDPRELQRKARRITSELQDYLASAMPRGDDAARIQKRMLKHWQGLFRFIDHPRLYEPTNNRAERALRGLIRIRRQTQGSRSLAGRQWNARITTVVETCKLQGINPWQFINQAIHAQLGNKDYPSLVPQAA